MAMTRAMARAMMPRLVGYGWSGRRIWSWLGKYKAQYHHATFYKDLREFKDIAEFGSKIIKLADEARIPHKLMSEVELARPRRYRVFGRAKYRDLETGRTWSKRVSFYDDTEYVKREWGDEYIRQKRQAAYEEGWEVEDISIVHVQHMKGWSY